MGIYDGRTYRTFANELGDIQYFFENVKDVNSLKIWEDSAAKGSVNYDTKDEKYAGEYSRQYEIRRFDDVKRSDRNTNSNGTITGRP